jgi:thioredoxin 1
MNPGNDKKKFSSLKILFIMIAITTGVICMAQMKSPCACSGTVCAASSALAMSETKTKVEEKKEEKLPQLIDLGAKKCIPCKMMAPILDELGKEYKGILIVKFIDVWMPENAAEAKKYKISSIPTQIFFDKEGKELWRHVGFISKKDLLKKWKELGYDFEDIKKNAGEKK